MPETRLELHAIPILRDNYVWALHERKCVVIVDPGESAPIVAWLQARGLHLSAILVTHHHGDHCAGVNTLRERFQCPAYGPAECRQVCPEIVSEGNLIRLNSLDTCFEVIALPGHTLGHVGYYGEGILFCGDTLFSCGCGRIFEGTAEQMHASLSLLSRLPIETRVCCAHEYTLANLAFAMEVEPQSTALQIWHTAALDLKKQGLPTLPTRLGDELAHNPFLRTHLKAVRDYAETKTGRILDSPMQVFAALRAIKDVY